MPNIKSAKKRMRTSAAAGQANRQVKSRITTQRAKLSKAIADGDKATSQELFKTYCSILDKAVKKGVVKANTADRRKSRVAAKLKAMA